MTVPKIYEAISNISKEAGALAPTKNGAGVPFAFRGVDATVSHVAPYLKKHGVIVVPEVLDSFHSGREVGNKVVTQTEIRTRFHFIHVEDGSEVCATTIGLAQDFSDRSAAQAQSVSFRVALLQTFTLPTTDKEPEEVGEEVQREIAAQHAKTPQAKVATQAPRGPSLADLRGEIKALLEAGVSTPEKVDEIGARISGKADPSWKSDATVLQRVIATINK